MPLSILLLEGDAGHREAMVRFLHSHLAGSQIQWVDCLAAAARSLQAGGVQVVVCALQVVDGCADDLLPLIGDVPALVVVPAGAEAQAAQAMRQGFKDFVVRDGAGNYLWTLPAQLQALHRQHCEAQERAGMEAALSETSRLLAEKTRALEMTLDSVSQGIVYLDAEDRILVHNQRFVDLLEVPAAQVQDAMSVRDITAFQRERGDLRPEAVYWPPGAVVGAPSEKGCPPMYIRKTPSGRYVEVRTQALRSGHRVRTFADVTDYIRTQDELRQGEARWRGLTELSSDWYWEQDADFRFVRIDGSAARLSALPIESLLGRTRWDVPATLVSEAEWDEHRQLLQAHEPFYDWEIQRLLEDGSQVWLAISGAPMFDPQQQFTGYRGIVRNITARKQAEAEVQRLAFFDELTQLPNRRAMRQRLDLAVARSAVQGAGGLMLLGLDRFKDINDSMGHGWGDRLLAAVTRRMQEWNQHGAVIGRVGGDEFLVLHEGLGSDAQDALSHGRGLAQELLQRLSQPYELDGRTLHTSASLGILAFSGTNHDAQTLQRHVDLALSQAKAQGRNTWSVFTPEMQTALQARTELEAELRRALAQQEFELHYQPVVGLQGEVLGAEALVRWLHPVRGRVSPAEFIPLAEQTGQIVWLDRLVLRLACLQLARWSRQPATQGWTLSVNLSAHAFRHKDFVQQVLAVVHATGARPDRLKLELTEGVMLHDVEMGIAKMQLLRAQGIRFSLDDFGTGYSSLAYLKRLPLAQLKIDRGFVRDVLSDGNDASIVRTVIALGQSLGLEVVAEGVETEAQRNFLADQGCQRFQGYLFGRPGPVADLELQARQSQHGDAVGAGGA